MQPFSVQPKEGEQCSLMPVHLSNYAGMKWLKHLTQPLKTMSYSCSSYWSCSWVHLKWWRIIKEQRLQIELFYHTFRQSTSAAYSIYFMIINITVSVLLCIKDFRGNTTRLFLWSSSKSSNLRTDRFVKEINPSYLYGFSLLSVTELLLL